VRINYHEHAFQISPILKGDELDDIEKSIQEFKNLKTSGFEGYVDATPLFLGRNPGGLVKLIQETGLSVFPVTGFHHSGHYSDSLVKMILERGTKYWVNILIDEILLGMANSEDAYINNSLVNRKSLKAKVLKVGLNKSMSDFEDMTLAVIQNTYHKLKIPVMVHLDVDNDVISVAQRIIDLGIEPTSTVLAHIDRQVNFDILDKLTDLGFFLGFDSFIRVNDTEIEKIYKAIERYPDHILIGGDFARSSRYLSYGGGPGIGYTGNVVIKKISKMTNENLVKKALEENPNRWLNS
jgi:phosphotriesterase-related protein